MLNSSKTFYKDILLYFSELRKLANKEHRDSLNLILREEYHDVLTQYKSLLNSKENEYYLVFLWKNKRGKLKRVGLYQNFDIGGLRMPDLECMIKALRMAWIPRLLKEGHQTGRPYLITSSRDAEAYNLF